MAFQGADPEALDRLGALLDHAATHLDEVGAALRLQLQHVMWRGPDAERFRAQFTGADSRALAASGSSLRDAAHSVRANAAAQRAASAPSGGTSGGSGPHLPSGRAIFADDSHMADPARHWWQGHHAWTADDSHMISIPDRRALLLRALGRPIPFVASGERAIFPAPSGRLLHAFHEAGAAGVARLDPAASGQDLLRRVQTDALDSRSTHSTVATAWEIAGRRHQTAQALGRME